jgi:hypothetical protein
MSTFTAARLPPCSAPRSAPCCRPSSSPACSTRCRRWKASGLDRRDLPDHPLPHHQPRHLLQGAGLCRPGASFMALLIAIPVLTLASACAAEEAGALKKPCGTAVTSTNIWHLGIKELRSLLARPDDAVPDRLHLQRADLHRRHGHARNACTGPPIAMVDEDRSPLSARIVDAFYPPTFMPPGASWAGRHGQGHGRRPLHLRARHSAQLPARRAGRARATPSSSTWTPPA